MFRECHIDYYDCCYCLEYLAGLIKIIVSLYLLNLYSVPLQLCKYFFEEFGIFL
jgi:hypothetical protein